MRSVALRLPGQLRLAQLKLVHAIQFDSCIECRKRALMRLSTTLSRRPRCEPTRGQFIIADVVGISVLKSAVRCGRIGEGAGMLLTRCQLYHFVFAVDVERKNAGGHAGHRLASRGRRPGCFDRTIGCFDRTIGRCWLLSRRPRAGKRGAHLRGRGRSAHRPYRPAS